MENEDNRRSGAGEIGSVKTRFSLEDGLMAVLPKQRAVGRQSVAAGMRLCKFLVKSAMNTGKRYRFEVEMIDGCFGNVPGGPTLSAVFCDYGVIDKEFGGNPGSVVGKYVALTVGDDQKFVRSSAEFVNGRMHDGPTGALI